MNSTVRKTTWLMVLVGLVYFLIFIPPNLNGSANEMLRQQTQPDEALQYNFLMRMYTPGKDIKETISHLVDHLHYIYGYPFYIANALVVLPVFLATGDLNAHAQIILLLLRQLISVLPMLCAIGLLVYLRTRFRSVGRSLLLFLFLLSIPAIIRQNIQWWHPDGLAILCVMFTFFFLDRDQLRFGKNFYLAALFCGLATAVKLIGVFFFLTIGVYLLWGLVTHRLTWKRAMLAGGAFVLIMLGTFILLNPMLLHPRIRPLIIQTQTDHNYYFTHGWDNGDQYAHDPLTWLPVYNRWYAPWLFILFAFGLGVANIIYNRQRLLNSLMLAWVVPYTAYTSYMIVVRPDHYWLVVMLLLLSGVLSWVPEWDTIKKGWAPALAAAAMVGCVLFVGGRNVQKGVALYEQALLNDRLILACDTNSLNKNDGAPVKLEEWVWYLEESYDYRTQPPTRQFTVRQGPGEVKAVPSEGVLAYRCTSKENALFKAENMAKIYKRGNPEQKVLDLNGNVVEAFSLVD